MSSNRLVRASVAALVSAALLCGRCLGAGRSNAAADAELDEITVTGSRVITDNVRSPTPITAISAEEIIRTTPSDIPDALNKLPTILGGRTPRTQGNGSTNNGGNVLSLRTSAPRARWCWSMDAGSRRPIRTDPSTSTPCRRCW